MSKEIEEMAKIMCQDAGTKNCNIRCDTMCDVYFYAVRLYKEWYLKKMEKVEQKIANQRKEIRSLRAYANGLQQSRDEWKRKAEKVGKQLFEELMEKGEHHG